MVKFSEDLKNKIIVITGAGGVLCSEFAKEVAQCGAKVALLDINLDNAKRVANEITAQGGIARPYMANILDKGSLAQAHAAITEELGSCDILINGAGGNSPEATTTDEFYTPGVPKSFFELTETGINRVFALNFTGTLFTCQEFASDMLKKGKGSIINISSMNAYTPLTKIPAYSAAKAAVSNFTQWLATYFSKTGIRVNAIAPGFFLTEQNRTLLTNDDGSLTPRAEKIIRNTPMERFGEASELLGTLVYLISDSASSFVTGIVIPVDGGFSAYSGV